ISEAIRDGAEGFFRTQYGTISKMAMVLALAILGIYLFRSTTPQQESSGLSRCFLTPSRYIGMWVSVRANVRVSSAARRSAREALQQIAVRAGGLSAIVVVGMAVIGVAVLYATFYVFLEVDSPGSMKVTDCKWTCLKVGDNVGDCAARGADLFESIAAEIISAMILGGTMAQRCKLEGKG
ncbi:hypothetical protein B296_00036069, partial [Ensete ventricosum]